MAAGVTPNHRRNSLVRWAWSAYPAANAISDMGIVPCTKALPAIRARCNPTQNRGDAPVNALMCLLNVRELIPIGGIRPGVWSSVLRKL